MNIVQNRRIKPGMTKCHSFVPRNNLFGIPKFQIPNEHITNQTRQTNKETHKKSETIIVALSEWILLLY